MDPTLIWVPLTPAIGSGLLPSGVICPSKNDALNTPKGKRLERDGNGNGNGMAVMGMAMMDGDGDGDGNGDGDGDDSDDDDCVFLPVSTVFTCSF